MLCCAVLCCAVLFCAVLCCCCCDYDKAIDEDLLHLEKMISSWDESLSRVQDTAAQLQEVVRAFDFILF